MLTAIEDDHLHWDCLVYDPADGELTSCGQAKQAHLDKAHYLTPDMAANRSARGLQRLLPARLRKAKPQAPLSGQGAVIALPKCECGVQTFLKADYSVKEAWKCVLTIKNDNDEVWAYAMRPQHARNLVAHWLLYERGKAPFAPVLPMPSEEVLQDGIERLKLPLDTLYAIWFGFQAVQHRLIELGKPPLTAIEAPMEQLFIEEKV